MKDLVKWLEEEAQKAKTYPERVAYLKVIEKIEKEEYMVEEERGV